MNKAAYLKALNQILEAHDVLDTDILSIIADYDELYNEGMAKGLTDDQIINQLGTPKTVYEQLKHDLHFKVKKYQKFIAITPFIAVISFVLIGQILDGWRYAWLVFLLIPITAIILNAKGTERIIGLSPFIALISFMYLGYEHQLWHPGWLIFLLTPVIAILLHGKFKEKLIGISPFVALIFAILWTHQGGQWRYAWLLYLLPPLLAYITSKDVKKRLFGTLSLVFAIGLYLVALANKMDIGFALIAFSIPIIYGIWQGDIQVSVINLKLKNNRIYLSVIALIVLIYLVVSFTTQSFYVSWVILLLIPCVLIHQSEGFKHVVAYMPFIATIVFIGGGMLFGYWGYLWMVYLLIPIVAILENKEKVVTIKKHDVTEDETTYID